MRIIDLKLGGLLKNRRTGWLAVSPNFEKVLTRGRKLNEVAEKTKQENVYYIPVTKNLRGFIGRV